MTYNYDYLYVTSFIILNWHLQINATIPAYIHTNILYSKCAPFCVVEHQLLCFNMGTPVAKH